MTNATTNGLAPSILTRLTQVALALNAIMATIAAAGFAMGLLPHALEQPLLAHRVAAGELGGAFLFGFVAARLPRDPGLIWPALAFVGFNLVDSVYEVVMSGDELPPTVVEGVFFAIYLVFAVSRKVSAGR